MKSLFKYGAVASIFLMTAGPAALAQNYNPTYGQGGGQGWNQGSGWNQNQGGGWNQGGFSGGGQGASQNMNEPSQQDAQQELSKYGFNNIRGLERSEGWEAHATKNGDQVHVFINDDGMIATYSGP
jgi:hypothetical protein